MGGLTAKKNARLSQGCPKITKQSQVMRLWFPHLLERGLALIRELPGKDSHDRQGI